MRRIRDRPNPYWGVDPLLAFLLEEVEEAERGVEYRQRELEDAMERAKQLREIFSILETQRHRQSGSSAQVPPRETRDGE